MNKDIKVTIPMYSVTAFLIAHTDMNIKEKITETFAAFAKGDLTFKGVDLSFNIINDDKTETKETSFIKPSLDLSDIAVVTCLAGYKKYKVSSVLRGIFETAVIIKNHKKLLENGCFGAAPKQIVNDPTFDEIVDTVKKGTPFETTIAKLVSSTGQEKRTTAFVDRIFDQLKGLSIVVTRVNGEELSGEAFKTCKNAETEIILKLKDAQKTAEPDTDDETAEAADAAEAEDDSEDQAAEASEASEPEAKLKPYEVDEPGDPLEDFSSMKLIS